MKKVSVLLYLALKIFAAIFWMNFCILIVSIA